jgi:hypothetical protein
VSRGKASYKACTPLKPPDLLQVFTDLSRLKARVLFDARRSKASALA